MIRDAPLLDFKFDQDQQTCHRCVRVRVGECMCMLLKFEWILPPWKSQWFYKAGLKASLSKSVPRACPCISQSLSGVGSCHFLWQWQIELLRLIHIVNNNTPSLRTKEPFIAASTQKDLSRNKNAPWRGNKSILRDNKRREKVVNSQNHVPQGEFFLFKAVTQ